MTVSQKNKKKDVSKPTEKQMLYDDENAIKEKALMQMIHDENPELAHDLIEWEDNGEGHFISR